MRHQLTLRKHQLLFCLPICAFSELEQLCLSGERGLPDTTLDYKYISEDKHTDTLSYLPIKCLGANVLV